MKLSLLTFAVAAVTAALPVTAHAEGPGYTRECGGTVDVQCWEYSCRAVDCFVYDCVLYVDVLHSNGSSVCVGTARSSG